MGQVKEGEGSNNIQVRYSFKTKQVEFLFVNM